MSDNEVDTTNILLDEERRQASHQEVKAAIDENVNTRLKQESTRVDPKEAAAVAGAAQELKQKAVRDAVGAERELVRGRTAARISQVVDYIFYLIYGLIALEFLLGLMGARAGNGFVQFIGLQRPARISFEYLTCSLLLSIS